MYAMILKKAVPVLAGFATIAGLSSVFARIQGTFGPSANAWLGQASVPTTAIPFISIKLLGLYCSCILGGMVTTWLGGTRRANLWVGAITSLMIGWLWLNTVHPIGFWILLMLGVVPCVLLGYQWVRKTS